MFFGKAKAIVCIVFGIIIAVALFCLVVGIGCAVNGMTFTEQIVDWFTPSSVEENNVDEEAADGFIEEEVSNVETEEAGSVTTIVLD